MSFYDLTSIAFVHDPRFTKELEQVLGNMPRGDEFMLGVERQLCANPYAGRQIAPDFPIRVLFSNVPGYTGVGVYYVVEGERVRLLSIYNSLSSNGDY